MKAKALGFMKCDGHRSCRCHFHVGLSPMLIALPSDVCAKKHLKIPKVDEFTKVQILLTTKLDYTVTT